MTGYLRLIIVLTLMITTVSAVHYYFIRRLARDPMLTNAWRRVVTIAIIVLGVSALATFGLGRVLPFSVSQYVVYLPYIWMGCVPILFLVFLGGDVVRLALAGTRKLRKQAPLNPQRRRFFSRLLAGAAAVTTVELATVSVLKAAGEVSITRVDVTLDKLPRALSGFTIVQLSDLHIGLTLGRDWLAEIVNKVNELKPDMIAITGDLVDGSVDRLKNEVAPLRELKAPDGVFFVTGNHEYYAGAVEWLKEIERLGIRVLRNERVSVGRGDDIFDLAGIDDHSSRGMAPGHDGPDIKRALEGRDPNRELVLLAHQPLGMDEVAASDVGLMLSGHTHGGQIWPITNFVIFRHPYNTGLHRHGARTQIFVTQGTGYWGPPMRLGSESEIAVIKLMSGSQ